MWKGTFLVLLTIAAGVSMLAHAQQCGSSSAEADTVSCLGSELRESDLKINAEYGRLMASLAPYDRAALKDQQRQWLRKRNEACHLNRHISNREVWIQDVLSDYARTACVIQYTRSRIAALEGIQGLPTIQNKAQQASVVSPEKKSYDTAYDHRPATVHTDGKWYFEVQLNYSDIARISPTVVTVGVWDLEHFSGTIKNVTLGATQSDVIGIAVDLDNGKLYVSQNGAWVGGLPGSNQGTDLKLGRRYYATFLVSAADKNKEFIDKGAIAPNFGDRQMVYAIPGGYRPWRS